MMKKINLLATLFLAFSAVANAQQEAVAAATAPEPSNGLSTTEILVLALFILTLLILIASILVVKTVKILVREQANPQPFVIAGDEQSVAYQQLPKQQGNKTSIWTRLLGLKPLEQEKDIVIPHAYDEIHELDNPVPRWFNVLFYGTLVFAVAYLIIYHVADIGDRQDTEYVKQVEKAAIDKRLYLAKTPAIDENSIKFDQSMVANGATIYAASCAPCHGDKGQGLVGPNLCDEFWLHGGSIKDVFKTIKSGFAAKGMPGWEKNMSAKNLAEVASYVISLKGTNPDGAKAAQGEKYEGE